MDSGGAIPGRILNVRDLGCFLLTKVLKCGDTQLDLHFKRQELLNLTDCTGESSGDLLKKYWSLDPTSTESSSIHLREDLGISIFKRLLGDSNM